MKNKALWTVIIVGLLSLGACSTSAPATDSVDVAAPLPTDTPVPPTEEPTPVPPKALPDTPVSAVLGTEAGSTYKVDLPSFAAMTFEDADLPAVPGSVTAQWYVASDRYVVAYAGLDLAESGAVCPGNSILTGAGFQHVSNAPTEEGACEGFPTLTTDPEVGPVVCQGAVVYVTAIPSDLQGTLFGTPEALTEEGDLVGLTSTVQSVPDMPVLDLVEFCG
jgi:hypothetical protein